MTVNAIYENGVFTPQEPVRLAEPTHVDVLKPAAITIDADPTGWKAAEALIGCVTSAAEGQAEFRLRCRTRSR